MLNGHVSPNHPFELKFIWPDETVWTGLPVFLPTCPSYLLGQLCALTGHALHMTRVFRQTGPASRQSQRASHAIFGDCLGRNGLEEILQFDISKNRP